MKMSKYKSKYVKNINLSENDTPKIKTNSPESISYTINDMKTMLKNPIPLISCKNSSKSLSKLNTYKNNNSNFLYINGNCKNKKTKNSLQVFMYFHDLNTKLKNIEIKKKYKNLIEKKNNDINTLQKEIEYYRNFVKDNKKNKNNKISLSKNPSDIFLSTILTNKRNKNKKINTTPSSNSYFKNALSYDKYKNLKILDFSKSKNNNRKFKSKENSNINNLYSINKSPKMPINFKKYFNKNIKINFSNFKQKNNILTSTNTQRNNFISSIKSYNKKYYFNSDDIQNNNYKSRNNIAGINSIDSNDICSTIELKNQKKFETNIKINALCKNKNENNSLYSNKNSTKKIISNSKNSFYGETCGEESYNNDYCKEKFENVINRTENLLKNLFSIIYNKKKDYGFKNK